MSSADTAYTNLVWKRARARRKSVAVHCKMLRLPVADTLIRLGHLGVQVARNLTGDFGKFMTIYFETGKESGVSCGPEQWRGTFGCSRSRCRRLPFIMAALTCSMR